MSTRAERDGRRPYDFVVVGSGFGGSVAALRLAEKGYSVLVLERGAEFQDDGFAQRDWDLRRFLWLPALALPRHPADQRPEGRVGPARQRCGRREPGLLRGPRSAVGRGLRPTGVAASRSRGEWSCGALRDGAAHAGVTANPKLWPADAHLEQIAAERGYASSFRPTQVGIFFGEPGVEVPDPYFDGQGPPRQGLYALWGMHGWLPRERQEYAG